MRIISVDPGTNNAGVSILEQTETGYHVVFAETINAVKLARGYKDISSLWGDLEAKIEAIVTQVAKVMDHYEVSAFAYEDSYVSPRKSITSYKVAIKLQDRIVSMIIKKCPIMEFMLITPSKVKNAVGVSGRDPDKEAIPKAIRKMPVSYAEHLNPDTFDEHTWDSIAVGISFFKQQEP